MPPAAGAPATGCHPRGPGADALRVVKEHPEVDAILLDWNMPVMDGLTFLKQLRGGSGAVRPVVVMCTTENDMPRIVEAMQAGANEYIMKPFDEEILIGKFGPVGLL